MSWQKQIAHWSVILHVKVEPHVFEGQTVVWAVWCVSSDQQESLVSLHSAENSIVGSLMDDSEAPEWVPRPDGIRDARSKLAGVFGMPQHTRGEDDD